jgi:hypothetical protein
MPETAPYWSKHLQIPDRPYSSKFNTDIILRKHLRRSSFLGEKSLSAFAQVIDSKCAPTLCALFSLPESFFRYLLQAIRIGVRSPRAPFREKFDRSV